MEPSGEVKKNAQQPFNVKHTRTRKSFKVTLRFVSITNTPVVTSSVPPERRMQAVLTWPLLNLESIICGCVEWGEKKRKKLGNTKE